MTIIPNFEQEMKNIYEEILINEITGLQNKLEQNGNKVYRNGYYSVNYKTEVGNLELNIPRLRNHGFKYECLNEFSYSQKLCSLIVDLYGHGLSTSRIKKVLSSTFSIEISKQSISTICQVLNLSVTEFLYSCPNEEFVCIYLDGKYFSVKDKDYSHKSVFMTAIGLTAAGKKIVIHSSVLQGETKKELMGFLKGLNQKIKMKNPIFIVDGLDSIADAINTVFGDVPIQRCLVHVVRNIKKGLKGKVTADKLNEIENDFNRLFFEVENSMILSELQEIIKKYSRHARLLKNIIKSKRIWTFINYNSDFSKIIKTNNIIEQFHSNLESVSKQHRSYGNDMSLFRALIQEIKRYNFDNDNKIQNTRYSKTIISDYYFQIGEEIKNIKQDENMVM
ncbi:MAG: IS256 family transposase [Anaeroplasmataceae bacterium]